MSETTPQPLPHQELRDALKAGPTGGRWRWEINLMSKCLHLVGGPYREFDLTIMDFDRWGMSNAVATLRDTSADGMNIMHRLPDRKDWFAPFPGRAHHADWCQQVTHPDMKWIEAANPKAITALLKDRDQLATDAQNCKELIWALARELKCLPSTFSDANGHVLKAAIALNAERDRLAADVANLTAAASDVQAERRRQIEVEGWTPERDDGYTFGELARAGAAYAAQSLCAEDAELDCGPPKWWPWSADWWKPTGRRRMLVKAGALILAEIERLDRAAMKGNP